MGKPEQPYSPSYGHTNILCKQILHTKHKVFFADEFTEGVNIKWGTFSMWTNTMGKRDSMFSFKVTTQKWIIVPKWVSVKMDFFNGTLKYLYCCVLMVTLIFLPPSLARVRFRFVIISRASSLAIFLTRSSVMYLTPAWPPVDAKRNHKHWPNI